MEASKFQEILRILKCMSVNELKNIYEVDSNIGRHLAVKLESKELLTFLLFLDSENIGIIYNYAANKWAGCGGK